jgi:hypothetical protein
MNDSVKIWLERAESSYKLGIIGKREVYSLRTFVFNFNKHVRNH